jgi:hypothetical protein
VPLLAIALVAALGLMPALIFKFLDSRAERRATDVSARLQRGMSPSEVLDAIRDRAVVASGDSGCWESTPSGVCREMRLVPRREGTGRTELPSFQLLFDEDAKLLEVVRIKGFGPREDVP